MNAEQKLTLAFTLRFPVRAENDDSLWVVLFEQSGTEFLQEFVQRTVPSLVLSHGPHLL